MDRNLLSVLQTYPDGLWRWPHVVRTMVYQLVCALAFCHDRSVLHRGMIGCTAVHQRHHIDMVCACVWLCVVRHQTGELTREGS